MGVQNKLVCGECKKFIDLHKSHQVYKLTIRATPPTYLKADKDSLLQGGYWESRALWFLWKHKEHKDLEMKSDHDGDWYDIVWKLEEVYPYKDES